jgi:serine/threonine protein kinase
MGYVVSFKVIKLLPDIQFLVQINIIHIGKQLIPSFTVQIALGLKAAHKQGVIHRDIRSANIMASSKDVEKIMDFGLAKLDNRSKLTQAVKVIRN